MKNLFKSMMAVAVAAMSFASCSTDVTEEIAPAQEFTVKINAAAPETRTVFGTLDEGEYPTLWEGDETIKVALNVSTAKSVNIADVSNDGASATFDEVTFTDDASGSYTIYAVSPASAANGLDTQYKSWTIVVPTEQTPTATSCDPAAQILVGKSATTTSVPSEVTMNFNHFTAYAKINFTNVALNGAVVESINISSDGKIAGQFYNYPTQDKANNTNYAETSIKVNTSSITNVWVALAPTAVTKLTFTITTNKGAFVKEFKGLTKEFKAGYIATFNVDMNDIDLLSKKYEIVKNITDLAEGDNVIIAAADYDKVMSNTTNETNIGSANAAKSGDYIYTDDDTGGVTIHDAGVNLFALKLNDKYLYAASKSSNHLKAQANNDANGYWDISIDNNTGIATIVAQGENTRNTLLYNTSGFFSCYSSTSSSVKEIVLYHKSNGGTPFVLEPQIVVSDIENVSADGVTNATANIVIRNLSGAITATPDGTVVTAASVNENVVTYSVAANNGAARDGSITLKCGAYEKVVKVSQLEKTVGYAAIHTSNVTLTTTGGTSASNVKVKISGTEYNAIKAGTNSASGAWKVTVPAGTTKLHVHLAGWKGANVTVKIEGATATPATLSLKSDDGITSSSPFTLQGNPTDFYHEIALSGITSETTLTVTATAGKRFVAWGVNAE